VSRDLELLFDGCILFRKQVAEKTLKSIKAKKLLFPDHRFYKQVEQLSMGRDIE